MEKRIAMWSGPRNISTAMMRSWGNREDTFVCDEPLYAHYLKRTGLEHPGAEEVMRHHETDWRRVVTWLTGPVPEGRTIFYQKQMSHHLLPEIDRGWLDELEHAFLIRDPDEMLASLSAVYPDAAIADTGLPQQVEIFERVRAESGRVPPVIDARDVLEHPAEMLSALCASLDVEFTERMLHWPAGPRPTDGIWAEYWYDSVMRTTGFLPRAPRARAAPPSMAALLRECNEYFELLHAHRLRPGAG